jgi:hypothetical protein
MVRLPHGRFIPERLTDEPLHRPDIASCHAECHRLNRLPCEGAELAHHVVEKLVPRFLPGKTGPKGRVEAAEFAYKRINIAARERKLGNGKCLPSVRQVGNILCRLVLF